LLGILLLLLGIGLKLRLSQSTLIVVMDLSSGNVIGLEISED
jgi:hypothetical protein